jgi:hypothetical protein
MCEGFCAIVCVAVGVWNARFCAWLWEYGMHDFVRGCGSMECAILCVAVGVRIARMHTLMTEYSRADA